MKSSAKRNGIILLILLLALSVGFFAFFYLHSGENSIDAEISEQRKLYAEIMPTLPDNSDESTKYTAVDYLADARSVNSEVVAWITIPDTNIDFPIVQTTDNDFYLTHSFEMADSNLGVPFLDYRNHSDFSDFNSIVYGHNMSKERMFAHVNSFRDKTYFSSHRAGTLILPDRICSVEFVCCAVVRKDCEIYQNICMTDPQKLAFMKELSANAFCSIEFEEEQLIKENLLILSTCTSVNSDMRTVLVGVICDRW